MRTRFICLALSIVLHCPFMSAQWVQTNGPNGVDIRCVARSGPNLFAGTWDYGAFLSTDNGTSWTAVNTGLPPDLLTVHSLAASGTNLFAGTEFGVFVSTNNGTSWTAACTGLTNSFILSLAISGTNLFAGTYEGVFLSTDNGTSWTEVNSGVPVDIHGDYPLVPALAVSGTNVFAGTNGEGVFLSTDNGTSWTDVNTGLPDKYIWDLTVDDANLFSGSNGIGVWLRPLSEMITSSVSEPSCELPAMFSLHQNYPNPFNPSTTIRFELPHASKTSLKIYNVLGQEVLTLVDEQKPAGVYETKFNAVNLSSGVYFCRLQAGDFVASEKLIWLK